MPGDDDLQRRLRALPAVDRVAEALGPDIRAATRTAAARRAIDEARARVRAGEEAPDLEGIVAAAAGLVRAGDRDLLQPVVNATGVLIHTNLGRVPLGAEQLVAVERVAGRYSNLEYDLMGGQRGSRHAHARALLCELTGADDALVVNNNAAAVLVTLAALCAGREVIISRGELVEIGGEFRIPDVMKASGAELVEVGTTNRTHVADYERAITPATAAILKVHPSNYRVVGFTAQVEARDLARLAMGRGVYLIHDLGSGLVLDEPADHPFRDPRVAEAVSDGADLVTFSGDKLLGGPQAGIIAGRRALIDKVGRHPLMRALRPDKMTLAALEATLRIYLEDRGPELPLWQMALRPVEELRARAERLAETLIDRLGPGFKVEAVSLAAVAGGGAAAGVDLPSAGIWIGHAERSSAELQRSLRYGVVPVIGRIDGDRLVLDLRTVAPEDDNRLPDLLVEALDT
ncbi:MAG TPA: L-seryl-tRNA(Sec) selenium transferase [Actinomycetota bacterium]|nr:L-seryl-tRNA(Sec) selenium transferase [Actinomycetota bacterium]